MTGVEVGVVLGVELLKLALQERALRQKLVSAGMSPEATDAALSKVRAEVAALPDPNTLPEV